MSIGLVGKLALVTAMVIGTYFMGDGFGAAPMEAASGPCDRDYNYNCCVYICLHDSSTGCNGRSGCCQNLCAEVSE